MPQEKSTKLQQKEIDAQIKLIRKGQILDMLEPLHSDFFVKRGRTAFIPVSCCATEIVFYSLHQVVSHPFYMQLESYKFSKQKRRVEKKILDK